jgi:hypothetical protein
MTAVAITVTARPAADTLNLTAADSMLSGPMK